MRKPLGEEMEFFRQYNEVLFNQLEKKILDKETANQHLRISVEEYRLQFENILDVVFMIGTDFNILSISPSVEKLLGYKAEDFIGRPASDLRHIFTSESFERAITNINKILNGEIISETIYAFVAKDGTLKHIEINGSPLIRDGQVAGTISVARDITERKLMEEKLRYEERRFRTFVEHSSDIIVFVNREGIVTYENPAVERSLGLKAEERIGVSLFERIHPDDLKFAIDAFNKFTLNTFSKDINAPVRQIRLRHQDGSWRTFEAVGSKLAHDNFVEFVIVNLRDITERKQAEEMLKESENKYRLLADNIHDVVFVMDMNLNYTYISPSVKILRGYEPEEALKHTTAETLTPSSADLAMRTLSEIMEIEKSEHREINISRTLQLEMSRKDGTTFWIEMKASFIRDENQRPVGIMGLTRDITERKKAEDELRESEHRYQELSIIDDLTQLYNSRHFYAQLEREIERSNRYEQPLTLLMLDIDNFKTFNDTYGHVEGDYVLSRLGQVIKRCLRETDSAYRYGGEEFMIMLPMTTSEEGIVTAKRIQTELRKEAFSPVLGQEVYMTVSIGLSQYKPKEGMKAFVNRIDQLMYQAKKNGRDRICPES